MKKIFISIFVFLAFKGICSTELDFHENSKIQPYYYSFSEIYETAVPAVVKIETYERASSIYEFFFGPSKTLIGIGSGFVYSSNGYIITNSHVIVDHKKEFKVILENEKSYDAELIGYDERTDIAILKIDEKNLTPLQFENSDNVNIGDWVVVLGNPFSLSFSLSVGVIGAKNRQNFELLEIEDFIQLDCDINPGNSGGPVLNLSGDVIGVASAALVGLGIGFAVPSNIAEKIANQLIKNGKIEESFIGITEIMNHEYGFLVSKIEKKSPAYISGLRQGDVILEYDNILISTVTAFKNYLSLLEPNFDVIILKILRDEKYFDIMIKV